VNYDCLNVNCECFNVKKQTSLDMTKIASETKCTIVVVGDSRTGKSALLHRFVHKSFQPVRHVLTLLLFKYSGDN
jgi:GTPase SAR1 family protein